MNPISDSPARFRTAIVTGGSTGLGYACARALVEDTSAAVPWNVVLASRDPARAQEAVEGLRREAVAAGSSARVEAMRLDLASLTSVRAFAQKVTQRLMAGELQPLHAWCVTPAYRAEPRRRSQQTALRAPSA